MVTPRRSATVRSAVGRNIDAVPVSTKTRPTAPRDFARVAQILVALELAEQAESLFAVEESADRHQGAVVGEPSHGGLEKSVVERGVGIHHHDNVVVALAGKNLRERLIERARLLVGVPDRLDDLDAVLAGKGDGRVGAIVSDDDDAFGPVGLGVEEESVNGSDTSSLCAGIRTVTVTSPANTPRVDAMMIFGASGVACMLIERRDLFVARRSNRAMPTAKKAANATAARISRGAGAIGS